MLNCAFSTIKSFWKVKVRPTAPGNGIVLIDLMHNDDEYLLRSLIVGSYTARILGARTIGLIGHSGVMRMTAFDRAHVESLADTFCLDEIIEVPGTPDVLGESSDYVIGGNKPFSLRDLEDLNRKEDEGGVRIGKFCHDTHLRTYRLPTVFNTPAWQQTLSEVYTFASWCRELFTTLRPTVFVTGHLDYCPWGLFGEYVLQAGGKILYFRCDGMLPLAWIDKSTTGLTLNGKLHTLQSECSDAFVANRGGLRSAIEVLSQCIDGLTGETQFPFWRTGAARLHFALPNLSSSQTRVIKEWVLYSHTCCDQPIADEQLFPNHYEWIRNTLEAKAGRGSGPRLTVKLHPLNDTFDAYDVMRRMISLYRNQGAIDFFGEGALVAHRAGITVRGSVAYEKSMRREPIFAVGRSGFTEFMVCPRVSTIPDYLDLLHSGECPDVSIEQTLRSAIFPLFDRVVAPPRSPLIPPFSGRQPRDPVWVDLASKLPWFVLHRDDLYQSLRENMSNGGIVVSRESHSAFYR